MIEIYKTNVQNSTQGKRLINALHTLFPFYRANFDLHDCDNILRIESTAGIIDDENIIRVMETYGFVAEPLPD
ncbi:MAG: hypothetical protein QM802_16405 [Agriterribacter sp.]